MENLTSITEHSEYLESTYQKDQIKWFFHLRRIEFGKRKLSLLMFFPCKSVGMDWVVLEEPKKSDWHYDFNYKNFLQEYQQAKESCLFEGYDGTIKQLKDLISLNITVESMVKYGLKLTEKTKKHLGY